MMAFPDMEKSNSYQKDEDHKRQSSRMEESSSVGPCFIPKGEVAMKTQQDTKKHLREQITEPRSQRAQTILTSATRTLRNGDSIKSKTIANIFAVSQLNRVEKDKQADHMGTGDQRTRTSPSMFQSIDIQRPTATFPQALSRQPSWDTYIQYPCPTPATLKRLSSASTTESIKTPIERNGINGVKTSSQLQDTTASQSPLSLNPPADHFQPLTPDYSLGVNNIDLNQVVHAQVHPSRKLQSSRLNTTNNVVDSTSTAKWINTPLPQTSYRNASAKPPVDRRSNKQYKERAAHHLTRSNPPWSNVQPVESGTGNMHRERPQTTDVVARRLIGRALGINLAKKQNEIDLARKKQCDLSS